MCIYIYIYVYTHIYIYMYVYRLISVGILHLKSTESDATSPRSK